MNLSLVLYLYLSVVTNIFRSVLLIINVDFKTAAISFC